MSFKSADILPQVIRFYFWLQFQRIARLIDGNGKLILLGLSVMTTGFIGLSVLLFEKTEFAVWIYALIAVGLFVRLGERGRNDHLKSLFRNRDYFKVRLLENGLTSFIFIPIMILYSEFYVAAGIAFLSQLMAIVPISLRTSYVIPTPFRKHPFEFIIGFRKTYLGFMMSYLLLIKAIEVHNYNLGLFAMGIVFMVVMSFFSKPEPLYYVWIFKRTSGEFLKQKGVTSALCTALIAIPALAALCIAFPENMILSIAVYLLAQLLIGSMIVAKYSAYPDEMSLAQGFLFAFGFMFPPLLPFIVWRFYRQSKDSLDLILE